MPSINSVLSVGGSLEDRAVVVLQNLEPSGDLGRVVLADLGGELDAGAKKCGAQLGDNCNVEVDDEEIRRGPNAA